MAGTNSLEFAPQDFFALLTGSNEYTWEGKITDEYRRGK
tara:strand:- start:214 stop:330 length:117 start_codon:yes stop_codon:yes gene_type:complete